MAISRITGPGLTVIALLVAVLWGCIIGERVLIQRANLEYYRAIRDVQLLQLRRRAETVSAPKPKLPRPFRPTLA